MPDKVGGVVVYSLVNPAVDKKETIPLKGAIQNADREVIAIASGYFTGVSIYVYTGGVTAGTLDLWCAKNGQSVGQSAQLGAGQQNAYRRLASDTYAFSAGDKLEAMYGTPPNYSGALEGTIAIWFAYDY